MVRHILIILATLTFSIVNASDKSSTASTIAKPSTAPDFAQIYTTLTDERNTTQRFASVREDIHKQRIAQAKVLEDTIRRIRMEYAGLNDLTRAKERVEQAIQDELITDARAVLAAVQCMLARAAFKTSHPQVDSRLGTFRSVLATVAGTPTATALVGDSDDPTALLRFAQERLAGRLELSGEPQRAMKQLEDYIEAQSDSEA